MAVFIVKFFMNLYSLNKWRRSTEKEELPGIFNWVMEGLRNFLKEGFNYNKNYEETKEKWIKYMINSGIRKISENELLLMPNI